LTKQKQEKPTKRILNKEYVEANIGRFDMIFGRKKLSRTEVVGMSGDGNSSTAELTYSEHLAERK
jgi:hypothetical protein